MTNTELFFAVAQIPFPCTESLLKCHYVLQKREGCSQDGRCWKQSLVYALACIERSPGNHISTTREEDTCLPYSGLWFWGLVEHSNETDDVRGIKRCKSSKTINDGAEESRRRYEAGPWCKSKKEIQDPLMWVSFIDLALGIFSSKERPQSLIKHKWWF